MSDLVGGEKVVKAPQKGAQRKARTAAASHTPKPSDTPRATIHQQLPTPDIKVDTTNPHYRYDARENDWENTTVNERRVKMRQKQIDYGYNTTGYRRYITHIPKEKRMKWDPATPNVAEKCSKRAWDGKCHEWRRQLHCFDPAPPIPRGWEAYRQSVALDTREDAISFSDKMTNASEIANHKFDAHLRVTVARISDYHYSRVNEHGESVVEHFTMTLADRSGFINCLVLSNRSRLAFLLMKVGRVYVIHNPILLDTKTSVHWIVFGPKTTVDEVIFCAEDITLKEMSLFASLAEITAE